MASNLDEQRKLEKELLRRAQQDPEGPEAQALHAHLKPVLAPPQLAELPQQTAATSEQAGRLLSHWVEGGDGGKAAQEQMAQEEEEERERRHGARGRGGQEGGEGGHLEDQDRRSTMNADFVPDSAIAGGTLDDRKPGGPAPDEFYFGGDGGDDGDGKGGAP